MIEITKTTNFFEQTKKNPRIGDTRIGQSGSALSTTLASIAELNQIIRLKKQP